MFFGVRLIPCPQCGKTATSNKQTDTVSCSHCGFEAKTFSVMEIHRRRDQAKKKKNRFQQLLDRFR